MVVLREAIHPLPQGCRVVSVRVLEGDVLARLAELPDESVQCVVTSPPYFGLRDYGAEGMIGLEPTFDEHLAVLVRVFREVRRVLRKDGTLWLNYGDAYAASGRGQKTDGAVGRADQHNGGEHFAGWRTSELKPKDLMMMPARVAMALQADGWWLRSEIIWHKPNPMPESATDRPTCSHEKLYLLTRSARYFYDADAVRTPTAQSTIRKNYIIDPETGEKTKPFRTGHKGNAYVSQAGLQQNAEATDRQIARGHDSKSRDVQIEAGANLRNVWTVPTHADSEAARTAYADASDPRNKPSGWSTSPRYHEGNPKKTSSEDRSKMPPAGQQAAGSNIRNVWTIATHAFTGWSERTELVPLSASQAQERAASDSGFGDDISRITSPDCPLHAGQPDRVPTGFCDGLSDPQLTRIRGNGDRHAQSSPSGSGSIEHTPVRCSIDPSRTDYQDPSYSRSAIGHSTEIHRTAPALESSPHATPCGGIRRGIEHTAPPPSSLSSTCHGTDANKTADDTTASHSAPQTAGGTARKSESDGACRCEHYQKVTSKNSHFATFPPKLVEPCIKAGTSETGCCGECGAPWARVVTETEDYRKQRARLSGSIPGARECTHCGFVANPVPCVVLDCFGGSGTVGLVADRLGRDAILIELNPEYAQMARERITDDAPLFADVV